MGQHHVGVQALVQPRLQVVGAFLPGRQIGPPEGIVDIPAQPHAQAGQFVVVVRVQGVVDVADVDVVGFHSLFLQDAHLLLADT